MYSLGKQFEQKFKEDFLKLEGSTIDRLYDQTSGRYGIRNICDFIGYVYPNIFYLEIKSHKGNTFPLSNLSQYDDLHSKVGIPGVRVGVILWFRERDRVCYVPISTIEKMFVDNRKSINVKYLDTDEYRIIEIPSVKRKVFMVSDYSVLKNLSEGD